MHQSIKSILSMSPVMPVLTINKVENIDYLFEALIKGNLKTVEITLRTDCALQVIEVASKKFSSLQVGAGTVLNESDLQSVKDAGASFAVSPGTTTELAKKAIEMDYPFLPGVSNSSDIMKLLDLGYKSFKFFPAQAAGGINYLKSLNGPFPRYIILSYWWNKRGKCFSMDKSKKCNMCRRKLDSSLRRS